MALTKRQYQVLHFLDSFINLKGYCPSYNEVRENLELSSLATIHKHIKTLEKKGFIRRNPNRSRSIELINRQPFTKITVQNTSTTVAKKKIKKGLGLNTYQKKQTLLKTFDILKIPANSLPLLGRIAAGLPLETFAENETLSLQQFIGNRNVYVLQVKGDSMIEDHICDGDYVVVESTAHPNNGDTVVALIGENESTLKRFYRENDGNIRLQPANSKIKPIVLKEGELKIQGKVISVLRKF